MKSMLVSLFFLRLLTQYRKFPLLSNLANHFYRNDVDNMVENEKATNEGTSNFIITFRKSY